MHSTQPRARYHEDDGVEMMRALCYGGLVVNKRPIFLAHVGNSNPLFSFSLCVGRKESGVESTCCCIHGSAPPSPLSDLKERFLCCSSVRRLWSLPVGERSSPTLFHAAPGLTSYAHNICLDAGRGLDRALSQPGPLFIHQLCLRMCGCVWSWGPPLSLTPLSLNTHPLSACWRGLGSFWALALGPLCVCDICPS